jgi:AraC family transcriptional activator of pobA
MQRISQFDGLYGETSSQPGGEYLFSERLETRSKGFGWTIQPHVHAALLQVFFLESGEVAFSAANRQHQLHAPVIMLIPAAALHGFVFTPNATGHVLTISDVLVAGWFPAASLLAPMLAVTQVLPVPEEHYSAPVIRQLIAHIDEELFGEQPARQAMLHVHLQRFLLVLYRLWCQAADVPSKADSPGLRYFRQFQQRLRQAGTTRSIAQLAAELAITPAHLNRICQAVVGKSASQLVQQQQLVEACKYLSYTTYSVSEIAYLLHFEYPNYFARFFRKHLGMSPLQYRASRTSA